MRRWLERSWLGLRQPCIDGGIEIRAPLTFEVSPGVSTFLGPVLLAFPSYVTLKRIGVARNEPIDRAMLRLPVGKLLARHVFFVDQLSLDSYARMGNLTLCLMTLSLSFGTTALLGQILDTPNVVLELAGSNQVSQRVALVLFQLTPSSASQRSSALRKASAPCWADSAKTFCWWTRVASWDAPWRSSVR